MTTYKEDIMSQPVALQKTIEYLGNISISQEILGVFQADRWKRIILTGMGSSYYALLPLFRRLLNVDKPVWHIETSELIYSPTLLNKDTLYICNSQSGASAETVRLLDKVQSDKQIIGITNTINSPLASRSAYALITKAGEEVSVSCKTYVSALAALCWLGDILLPGENKFKGLKNLPDLLQAYLKNFQDHIEEIKPFIDGVGPIFLVGRGISLTTATTGGLILKEATRSTSEGMSSASFRHGPFEMVSPQTFIMIFAGQEETIQLNRKLHHDVTNAGGRSVLVSFQDEPIGAFGLPKSSLSAQPILEILPVQMLSLAIADLKKFTAGSFHFAHKVTTVE